MDIIDAIRAVSAGTSLSTSDSEAVMRCVMAGEATPAQIGALLTALHIKGETTEEVLGGATVMRELATRVHVDVPHLVDTCGTGGSGAKLFNVSTAGAFVVSACGAHVAKHGNRAMSSSSGSADLLEAAGASLELSPEQVARCISEVGVGFLFAQRHHAAMKHVALPRREIGIRTMFNVLGPMTNPAGAPAQVLGVFSRQWQRRMAEVLQHLESRHVLVVHGSDGLDEITLSGATHVVELRDGAISEYEIRPGDFGIAETAIDALRTDSPQASLALVRAALAGEGAAADIVALNAGAAVFASGVALSLEDGVRMAQDAIDSGLARERMEEFVRVTQHMAESA